LNTSISACSSVAVVSFSSVSWMKTELSNSLRIASFELVSSLKPVEGSSSGSARSNVVIGSFRFRSMRAYTMPFLSISSSSHDPREGIRFAVKTCFVASFGSIR
jgi:hypothetical protein